MNRKTKYNKTWKDNYSPISPVSNDTCSADMTFVIKHFQFSNGGVARQQSIRKMKNWWRVNAHFLIMVQGLPGGSTVSLTSKEKVLRAEIIETLNLVDKNQRFSSSNRDGDRFRKMFPDSAIAVSYSQQETKTKNTVQFGIAPFVKNQLVQDVSNRPFTFKFDETTTSQVKKQYDAYIAFFSYQYQRIVTLYCVSLFVGHCTANDLLDHFWPLTIILTLPHGNAEPERGFSINKALLAVHGWTLEALRLVKDYII